MIILNKQDCYANIITTLSELNACKNDFKGELQALINERKKLYYTRDKLPENQNKEEILKEIEAIVKKILKVRKDIKLCDGIEGRTKNILEQIMKFEEKQKQEKSKRQKRKGIRNMKDRLTENVITFYKIVFFERILTVLLRIK